MGSVRTYPANLRDGAATPARWHRAAPIRRACAGTQTDLKRYLKSGLRQSSRRFLPSVQKPTRDRSIRIDPPVAQERPVAADIFEGFQVDVADQNFFAVVRGFGYDAAKRIAEKRSTPKFKSMTRRRFAADVASLKTNAIHHRDIDAIRDGVGALNGAPGVVLSDAELGFLGRGPTE